MASIMSNYCLDCWGLLGQKLKLICNFSLTDEVLLINVHVLFDLVISNKCLSSSAWFSLYPWLLTRPVTPLIYLCLLIRQAFSQTALSMHIVSPIITVHAIQGI